MKTNTVLSGAAIAAVLWVAGCAAPEDAASGNVAATTQRPAPTDGTPAPETSSAESLPPRLPQPNETRAPETFRPTPVASATAREPSPTTDTADPQASATVPPRKATTTPAAPKTTHPTPTPTRVTTAPQTTTQRPTTAAPATPRGNTMRIGSWTHGYVSDYGSQASIDRCNLVEWERGWFAGHDWCGYAFWASLGKGQTIVLTGRDAGTYTVTATVYLPSQGGKKPALPAYDIVLQTCKGSGTQLILARKTG